ncbi:hypothetical protein L083_5307 [Actinoplanes sp. N902-109]|nr:hypothetical protein L083_5307 [Actinoplanes sp. N902-109]
MLMPDLPSDVVGCTCGGLHHSSIVIASAPPVIGPAPA